MRFRELYRASFAHINPRPELLAATRELCQKEAFAPAAPKKHRWLHQSIRAQALGLAACLVLGFGLYLGLPEDMGTTQDPANTVQMARSMPDEHSNQGLEAYSAAPASASPAADKARTGAPMAASLPADSAAGAAKEYSYDCADYGGNEYDCLGSTESIYELPLAKYAGDSGPQPLFGAELLQQAHDSSCYLIRLGLWAYRYTMFK